MKIGSVYNSVVNVVPTSIEDCGAMQWLSERFKNKKVTLLFDTAGFSGNDYHPMMFISKAEDAPAKQADAAVN